MNGTDTTNRDRSGMKTEKTPFIERLVAGLIRFCLENKLIVGLLLIFVLAWGIMVAPFDWKLAGLPRDPIPTDAIPDIGENQQIVFTEWMGRSPQDVEDQISYPLTVSLLGVPGVKTIRSYSFFGFSSIYIIFKEDVDFYWSRSRVLEKLNSLPAGTLPAGVQPALGPDATSLGQIFWYTLEGRDANGAPTGGWDLDELRSVQDWYVRYALLSADGVSEVASVGGFVREYQVDVDPDAMRAADVTLQQVFRAVQKSNIDVGARGIELNSVEYFIRGLGFLKSVDDIENSVVKETKNVPINVRDVAQVTLGPALRRGALDKEGAEAVGGVVVVRYGDNPLNTIKNVKKKIEEVAPGLPERAVVDYAKVSPKEVEQFAGAEGFTAYDGDDLNQAAWLKWLKQTPQGKRPDWVKYSKVTVVPFYDRSGLIYETLGTLNDALSDEILVTIIVVLLMVMHLRSSVLISGLLPVSVLMCFIAMRIFGVNANIVSLSGIAIAIGSMVTMGIFLCENILKRLDGAAPGENPLEVIYRASAEVGSAVVTALLTTVVSFLPVFTMTAAEGKLFKPLAFTKTFAMIASLVVALTMLPPAAHLLFTGKVRRKTLKRLLFVIVIALGVLTAFVVTWWVGVAIAAIGLVNLLIDGLPERWREKLPLTANILTVVIVVYFLARHWYPLGPERGLLRNSIFVGVLIGLLILALEVYKRCFGVLLRWCLRHKAAFLTFCALVFVWGMMVWRGFDAFFGWLPRPVLGSPPVAYLQEKFPGLGEEFMPPLDEGSFLYMPSTMPHASIGEAMDVLEKQNKALASVPEIDSVVGKLGRVDSPLDPAPISMIETTINYKPEYKTDKNGRRIRFRYDKAEGAFIRDQDGNLIADPGGRPYRQWRDFIKSPDDIWNELVKVTQIPGTTSAPKLQPIAARIVMLSSGMRAPMGIKVKGPTLEALDRVCLQLERFLKEVPSVEPSAVVADRIIGKPYLEIDINRKAIARYGVDIRDVQNVIEVAIGGKRITTTVEGRERYPVRVRYMRELRDRIETLGRILVPARGQTQIPIEQVAEIRYVRGPQVIKSEDTFLTGYVVFDMKPGQAEVQVVDDCQKFLKEKIKSGEFVVPAGVSYTFAGNFENQVRSARKLAVVLPLALFIIFIILFFQFSAVRTTLIVFSTIAVAWAGGFIMIWLYGQPWFMDFSVFDVNMREMFAMHPINLSVAIWVGFLALFGIASDNGVVVTTCLDQTFRERKPTTREAVREATVAGALLRIRPTLMSSATTMLALLPVLSSTGRGSDIMVPMAIPSFGGMLVALLTVLLVPVLYSTMKERAVGKSDEARTSERNPDKKEDTP